MKGHVNEDLLEARRRTALHCRVRGQVDRDFVHEDEHAETQPTVATVRYLFAVLAGFVALWFTLFGPRMIAWLR